jgi:5,10-methenyltetrahydrofolate synthetase
LENGQQRKLRREQLLAARAGLPDRDEREQALRRHVAEWLARAEVRAVAFFWPIRGEPDLRVVMADWLAEDERRVAALPAVSGDTLVFHAWTHDAPMRAAEFGIPVPARGRPVQPDCLLVPCVGFDARRYRLGYGGGYYDRTLVQTVPWPLCVGIAFEVGHLDSIEPQAHDIALDAVITDVAIY